MELDKYLFQLQEKMIENKPDDYVGTDFEWSVNVIYWMAMAREKILDGTITIGVIEGVVKSLSK